MAVSALESVIPLLMLVMALLVLYWVIRKTVAAGIKDCLQQHGDPKSDWHP